MIARGSMTSRLTVLLGVFCVVVMTGPTSAHHSTAMYDTRNPVTIRLDGCPGKERGALDDRHRMKLPDGREIRS
jgi:hypothetical protein